MTAAFASSSRHARSDVAGVFDLDGVIIDSREHHLPAWHQLAREAGVTTTDPGPDLGAADIVVDWLADGAVRRFILETSIPHRP